MADNQGCIEIWKFKFVLFWFFGVLQRNSIWNRYVEDEMAVLLKTEVNTYCVQYVIFIPIARPV